MTPKPSPAHRQCRRYLKHAVKVMKQEARMVQHMLQTGMVAPPAACVVLENIHGNLRATIAHLSTMGLAPKRSRQGGAIALAGKGKKA